jgi:hypothetical protein
MQASDSLIPAFVPCYAAVRAAAETAALARPLAGRASSLTHLSSVPPTPHRARNE